MNVRQILFPQLLKYQYVGVKYGRQYITAQQIQDEISRRLEIAKDNSHVAYIYNYLLQNHAIQN